jgi:hypothetical protein
MKRFVTELAHINIQSQSYFNLSKGSYFAMDDNTEKTERYSQMSPRYVLSLLLRRPLVFLYGLVIGVLTPTVLTMVVLQNLLSDLQPPLPDLKAIPELSSVDSLPEMDLPLELPSAGGQLPFGY